MQPTILTLISSYFVENALKDLKAERPGLIYEGLMRVDVFQDANGDLESTSLRALKLLMQVVRWGVKIMNIL